MINLDAIRALMARRDLLAEWPSGSTRHTDDARQINLHALADEVPGLVAAVERLTAERDELRLTLLAEQGDPAGAPAGWKWYAILRRWGRPGWCVSLECPGRWAWQPQRPGPRRYTNSAREAMQAADKAAEGSKE